MSKAQHIQFSILNPKRLWVNLEMSSTNQNFKHFPGEMIMNNIKYQIFDQLGKTKSLETLKVHVYK